MWCCFATARQRVGETRGLDRTNSHYGLLATLGEGFGVVDRAEGFCRLAKRATVQAKAVSPKRRSRTLLTTLGATDDFRKWLIREAA